MIILLINTATTKNQVALITTGKLLAERTWLADRNQAETLLPSIKELFSKTGFGFQDLTGVLVVKGPGSFTSLRVGIVAANSIAYAEKVPIYGISTFDYFKLLLPKEHEGKRDLALILSAGPKRAYYISQKSQAEKAYEIDEVESKIKAEGVKEIYGSVLANHIEVLKNTQVEILETIDLSLLAEKLNLDIMQKEERITPLYIQEVNITWSDKIGTSNGPVGQA